MSSNAINNMGDITKYIQIVKDFNNSNYEYETVQKKEDIKIAHESGKMFVFPRNPLGEKVLMILGAVVSLIGLVISLIIIGALHDLSITFLIFIFINSITGGIGAIIVVSSIIKLIRIHKSFIVFDSKGIVKSSFWGVIRAYPWKDIFVIAYTMTTIHKRFGKIIYESPPNTEVYVDTYKWRGIKISPENYILKEFFNLDIFKERLKTQQMPKLSKDERSNLKIMRHQTEEYSIALFVLTIKYYFEMGKFGTSKLI